MTIVDQDVSGSNSPRLRLAQPPLFELSLITMCPPLACTPSTLFSPAECNLGGGGLNGLRELDRTMSLRHFLEDIR